MPKKGTRSPFRFAATSLGKRSAYSVHRGDQYLGFVELRVSRLSKHGATYVHQHGWDPTYLSRTAQRTELATEKTRELAARALWVHHMKENL